MKFSSYQESLAREAKQRGAAPNCAPCRCGSDMQRWSMFDSTVRAYLRIICEACDFAGPSAQYSARTGMLYYQGEWHVGNDRAFLIDLWNRAIAGETLRWVIPGALCLVLGCQMILTSFFLGVLRLDTRTEAV